MAGQAAVIADVAPRAAWVAGQADFVAIQSERIPEYTARLLEKYPLITTLDPGVHFISGASPSLTAAYVLALDSVNFGSGYFEAARQAGTALEYEVVARGLKHAFMQEFMTTPAEWAAATPAQCHDIFSIPAGTHPDLDALMNLFAHHLNATGVMIEGFYGGDPMNLLEEAQGSAVRLADILAAWPTFHDVSAYKGERVPVLKRAQILAADINLALEGKGLAAFSDMDRLTIFADNMVPHVLRCDGILEYAPDLAARIDRGDMIAAGSAEETEIRACAIHAVELMKRAADGKATSVNLDHILWHRGYEPDIYARPKHRTMTVWY